MILCSVDTTTFDITRINIKTIHIVVVIRLVGCIVIRISVIVSSSIRWTYGTVAIFDILFVLEYLRKIGEAHGHFGIIFRIDDVSGIVRCILQTYIYIYIL